MTTLDTIRPGATFRIVGLHGQAPPIAPIMRVTAFTYDCRIDVETFGQGDLEEPFDAVSIHLADMVAAIERGYLVNVHIPYDRTVDL